VVAPQILALIAISLVSFAGSVEAQSASPAPAPTASPQIAPVWHNPVGTRYSIFDPCGGPKELLNKINPSPCVLISGQAMLAGGYTNVTTNGSVSVTGPLQRGINLPISGNASIYPNLLFAFGVSPTSQLQISLPSSVNINTQRLGTTNASSDTAFDYKQFVYFNPTKYTLLALDAGYTAPTGDSLGPQYRGELLIEQPFTQNVGLGVVYTVQDTPQLTGVGTTQRVGSDPLVIYISYSAVASPLAVFPIVEHNFSPNRTIVLGDVCYLIGREFLVSVEYGGLGVSAAASGPIAHAFTFTSNASPRIFGVTLYGLIGQSNLPPALPQAAPSPTP
jgi:hypothetical protein